MAFALEDATRGWTVKVIGEPVGCVIRQMGEAMHAEWYSAFAMEVKALTPILNVSDLRESVAWFEQWGWKKLWTWGTPPRFGAVGSGTEIQIFLCKGGQGGRGRGTNTTTFQEDGDEEGDRGAWMSVWVDDVDEVHRQCISAGLEVTFPPTDMPWKTREMHLRHPDGHVFRISLGLEGDES